MQVGFLTVYVVTLGVTIVFNYCCLFFRPSGGGLTVVANALFNTIAGAPKLNTTGRTVGTVDSRFASFTSLGVTGNCTYTCPLTIINVVKSVLLIHILYHISLGTRRRRLRHGRTTGPRRAPFVVSLHTSGTCVSNHAVLRLARFLQESFIIAHVCRNRRFVIPGDGAIIARNSRLCIIYTRDSTRTVGTFVNPRANHSFRSRSTNRAHVISQGVIIAGRHIGNGALNGVRFSHFCNIGVSHVIQRNVAFFTSGGRRFRVNSIIAIINPRRGIRHITRLLNGTRGQLSRPGVVAVFVNVFINVVFNRLPVTLPNVPITVGLNITKNPLIVTVLLKHCNRLVGLPACVSASTGLVLHSVNLSLFLTYMNVGTNNGFIRAVIRNSKLLCILYNILVAVVPVLVIKPVTEGGFRFGCFSVVNVVTNACASPPTLTFSGNVYDHRTPNLTCTAICPLDVFLHVLATRLVVLFTYA